METYTDSFISCPEVWMRLVLHPVKVSEACLSFHNFPDLLLVGQATSPSADVQGVSQADQGEEEDNESGTPTPITPPPDL